MSLVAAVTAFWSPGSCLEHAAWKGNAAARIQSVRLRRERLVIVTLLSKTRSKYHNTCRLTARASAAGDPSGGARAMDAVRAPPGAQHSGSIKTIAPGTFKRSLGATRLRTRRGPLG